MRSKQLHLYDASTATVRSKQLTLWSEDDYQYTGLSCATCGRRMVRTPSGYVACPAGHGRLLAETDCPDDAA